MLLAAAALLDVILYQAVRGVKDIQADRGDGADFGSVGDCILQEVGFGLAVLASRCSLAEGTVSAASEGAAAAG